ncbi:MAG TPA: methyl-accepting chemotaxis protein, partial [bacterium]
LLQGYNAVIHMYNHLTAGWMPSTPLLYTPLDEVTVENYKDFWDEEQGEILSPDCYKRMVKPIKTEPGPPIRIAVVGRENSPFWKPMKKGVSLAANKLKPFGVRVDWIIPEKSQKGADLRASIYGPVLESLVAEKVSGIAVVAANRDLVPYINRVVKAGVPVATFNVDSENLRGILQTIRNQSLNLKKSGHRLTEAMLTVSRSMTSIEREMVDLDQRAMDQNGQIQNMRKSLIAFTDYMDQIHRETKVIQQSTDSVWGTLTTGSDAMEDTFNTVQTVSGIIEQTWKTTEALTQSSERIEMIVSMIDNIAARVNILSLNAAIESTKAKQFGRGFSEVAAEIRKLSQNTNDATQEVSGLLSSIQNGVFRVNKLLKADLERIRESEGKTEQTKILLAQIRGAIQKEDTRIRRIAQAVEDMQEASHRVGDGMENVAFVSTKNTMATQQVTATDNELVKNVKDVSRLADNLQQMAQGEENLLMQLTFEDKNGGNIPA